MPETIVIPQKPETSFSDQHSDEPEGMGYRFLCIDKNNIVHRILIRLMNEHSDGKRISLPKAECGILTLMLVMYRQRRRIPIRFSNVLPQGKWEKNKNGYIPGITPEDLRTAVDKLGRIMFEEEKPDNYAKFYNQKLVFVERYKDNAPLTLLHRKALVEYLQKWNSLAWANTDDILKWWILNCGCAGEIKVPMQM